MADIAAGLAAASADEIDRYLALVRAFPLEHIRDDAHLEAALAVFEPLFTRPTPGPAEEAYLGALADLIETYEDATVAIPRAPASMRCAS